MCRRRGVIVAGEHALNLSRCNNRGPRRKMPRGEKTDRVKTARQAHRVLHSGVPLMAIAFGSRPLNACRFFDAWVSLARSAGPKLPGRSGNLDSVEDS